MILTSAIADSQHRFTTVMRLMQHISIANTGKLKQHGSACCFAKRFGSHLFAAVAMLVVAVGGVQAEQDGLNGTATSVLDKHFIIGGAPVELNAYPWTVAIAYVSDAELVQRQFCGGSVIADQWVLTAAHCLFDRNGNVIDLSSFSVATNATNLRDPNAVEHVVSNAYVHPEYDHTAFNPHSDLALLELATSTGVTPITLSTTVSDKLVGLQATVIGWGAVDNSDPSRPLYPDWQHAVQVPMVSLEQCNAPESYADALYPNQLCAGYPEGGRDSCSGDSGGPLVVTYEGVLQQVGVVSFGNGCALADFYGVYTDVPYFINWINQYVYVGEPEFEPEALSTRGTTSVNTVAGSSSTGHASLFLLIIVGGGLLARRRS